jgi:hypothetical protein
MSNPMTVEDVRKELTKCQKWTNGSLKVAYWCQVALDAYDDIRVELVHAQREIKELKGEDSEKETSETYQMYKGFKEALAGLGYDNLNVRGRIWSVVDELTKLRRMVDSLKGVINDS